MLDRRQGKQGVPQLSVVVPVYNVEQYLAECLDSILGQDFTDLTVVVVNDGSTDGSAAVAAGYARRFPNVTLISSTNQGLGAARNLGVRHSRRLALEVKRRVSSEATDWVNRLPRRYDDCGFIAPIDMAPVTKSDAHRAGARWQLLMAVEVADIHREGPFRTKAWELELASAVGPDAAAVHLAFESGEGLILTVSPSPTQDGGR